MKQILIATKNQHKVDEFKKMLEPLGYEVLSLLDINQNIEIIEDGTTFQENAYKKAKAVYDALNIEVISDDSGICIDAFDGGPGIYSARFMGEDTSYQVKNQYIIDQLKDKENRNAHYTCMICYINKDGEASYYEGICEGKIADKISGEHGFGYDPIFYYPPYQTTLANVSEEEKNAISHRRKALDKLMEGLNHD